MSLAVVFHKLFLCFLSLGFIILCIHYTTLHYTQLSKFYTSMQCQCCHNIHVKSTVVIF